MNKLKQLRYLFVKTRYIIQRGYIFTQSMTMAIVGAGMVKLYFPQIQLWQGVIVALGIFFTAGYCEIKFKFIHIENEIATRYNPILMDIHDRDKSKGEKAE